MSDCISRKLAEEANSLPHASQEKKRCCQGEVLRLESPSFVPCRIPGRWDPGFFHGSLDRVRRRNCRGGGQPPTPRGCRDSKQHSGRCRAAKRGTFGNRSSFFKPWKIADRAFFLPQTSCTKTASPDREDVFHSHGCSSPEKANGLRKEAVVAKNRRLDTQAIRR
jgi:hypothetical protein